MLGVFSAIRIHNGKCKSRPIGNKESKNQPIEDKDKNSLEDNDKNSLECGMLYFQRALPYTIHIHDGSGNFEWLWY
jgi:hypothetical protein